MSRSGVKIARPVKRFSLFHASTKMHPAVALSLLPPAAGFVVGLAVGSLFGSLGWLHD